ncbi:MAG TPA: ChuX/HutX family heme-like substrate-binding protein [Accumulibacter sp.]|nr:ChuX/HutX family heme-like substrate-binding protein [Accumulibacter sp.]
MTHAALTSTPDGGIESMQHAWQGLREKKPGVQVRDAAALLGVSEAQLVASGCGHTATRLAGDWATLIEALPSLGRVTALTRNDHAIHEQTGEYRNVHIVGNMGLVLGEAIDLRLFLGHWHYGFAVEADSRSGATESLQFFDGDGTAVHKVYLTERSDRLAYARLVDAYRSPDQSPRQTTLAKPSAPPDRPDADIDVEGLRAHWRALRDTHDFHDLLKLFGASRTQGLRLGGPDLARPVEPAAAPALLDSAAELLLDIMVFVGSPGVVQIHTGPVNRPQTTGAWLNVLDKDFNLHLRQETVADAWVVSKPTVSGPVTSLELYDFAGNTIALFYGKRKPGYPENPVWRALVTGLPTVAALP